MSEPDFLNSLKQGIKGRALLCALFLLFTSVAQADEAILKFHSDITVNRGGSINVVEQITVNAQGRNIKRGIYRDLPTSYDHPRYGKFGLKSRAQVQVVGLQRNGKVEPFHTQELTNGVRVFFGSSHKLIDHGEHTYTLRYTAERQIVVNDNVAQLYWNVTGNGWRFNVERATAQVSLPGNSAIYQQEVYTGQQGSAASDAQFSMADNGDLAVAADEPLKAGQGMTIRLKFDAAEIVLSQPPGLTTLYRDNKSFFFGAGLLGLMAFIFLLSWLLIGRDPRRGIIIAQYRPVEGLSAAAHRAVYRNRVDHTSFSVGVLSIAIKGWLTISKPKKNTFRLTSTDIAGSESSGAKRSEPKPLSASETILFEGLFTGRDSVTLDGEYDSGLKALKQGYDGYLQDEFAKKAHQNHVIPLFIGGFVGLAGLVIMGLDSYNAIDDLARLMLVLYIVSAIVSSIFIRKINGAMGYSMAIISLGLAAANFYYESTLMAIGFSTYGIVLGLFMYLMPAPKEPAVGLLDQIEGFKLYLAKAEHDSLKRLNLPEKTPQLYEELLPYAIALDLETQWSGQFTDVLAAANWDSGSDSGRTTWYTGGSVSSIGSFAPAIAAGLASSVMAASTPPSSSSSGGGGFSGGGGGGGGGGGW